MVVEGKSALDIARYAREKQEMRLLFEDAVDKMSQGLTTLTEVFRISAQEN
jgi:type II secretory ATPase GspE/PulE/Tfp pilus assembly ATPase PilB-like protein